MFERSLPLKEQVQQKSAFLIGPRQTGKSTLAQQVFGSQALFINLLDLRTFQSIVAQPGSFAAIVERHLQKTSAPAKDPVYVVVDEIQKLPILLDATHALIEKHKQLRFLLTGSSARKLRAGGVNLLGGRARMLSMHPLCAREIKTWPATGMTWENLIQKSAIPSLLLSEHFEDDALAYTDLYLREEIQQEALVRRFPEFSRFLSVAAGANGQQIIFEKIAAKAGISAKIAKGYFEILADTLFAELLPSFKETTKRLPISVPKFYLFDAGLARVLQGRSHSDIYDRGEDLETYLLHEIKCYRDYNKKTIEISYWRSRSQSEVDFVLKERDRYTAIEVKTSRRLTGHDFSGLKTLGEEEISFRRILVNPFSLSQSREDGIEVLSVEDFLEELWQGKII